MGCESIFAEKMETFKRRAAVFNYDRFIIDNKDKPYLDIDDESDVFSGYRVIKVKR